MTHEQLTFDSLTLADQYKEEKSISSVRKYGVTLVCEGSVEYNAAFEISINQPDRVFELATNQLGLNRKPVEEFWCLCVDTKNKPIGLHMISRGSINSAIVGTREVFTAAVLNNAASVILMHNHPSGEPSPSQSDIDLTKRLVHAGEILGIKVLDHIIIGERKYVSLKEKGILV